MLRGLCRAAFVRIVCLEGTTASQRRSVSGYEVPGMPLSDRTLPGRQYLVLKYDTSTQGNIIQQSSFIINLPSLIIQH